jgi:hypothetical protein
LSGLTTNSPCALVAVTSCPPRSVSTIVTFAPAMTAPLGSFTTPARPPLSFWAIAPPQAKTNIPSIQRHDRSWPKCPDRREEEQRVNRFISVFLVRGEMGASFVLLRFDINSCDLAGKSIEKFKPPGMQGERRFLQTSRGFCSRHSASNRRRLRRKSSSKYITKAYVCFRFSPSPATMAGLRSGRETIFDGYRRLRASSSSRVRGQSERNRRDKLRSARTFPPV